MTEKKPKVPEVTTSEGLVIVQVGVERAELDQPSVRRLIKQLARAAVETG